jgi:Spy/CpxP family protein refolding chaperone
MRTARIAMALAIALLITTATVAQEKKKVRAQLSPVAQAMFRMQTLHEALEGLDLTEEQKAAHTKIHEEIGPKMKEIMDGMKEILTEEQLAAVKEAGEKAKNDGLTGRKLFATVEAAIKLTDEQKEKMVKPGEELAALQRQAAKKVIAILTPEQKEKVQAKMAPQGKKKVAGAKKKAD